MIYTTFYNLFVAGVAELQVSVVLVVTNFSILTANVF